MHAKGQLPFTSCLWSVLSHRELLVSDAIERNRRGWVCRITLVHFVLVPMVVSFGFHIALLSEPTFFWRVDGFNGRYILLASARSSRYESSGGLVAVLAFDLFVLTFWSRCIGREYIHPVRRHPSSDSRHA